MTLRAYYTSDELTLRTDVLSCTPTDDGKFQVVLEETLFHPQGGGQLADQGVIAGIPVKGVSQNENQVIHVLEHPVPLGPAEIAVSPDVRSLHARLHSAGHLISGVGQLLGWQPVKGHHWPGECRVVLERQPQSEALTAEQLEHAVNQLINDDVPRHLLDQNGLRTVSFGTLPMHGCGGTHVVSAGEIGPVKVLKIKEKKGQLSVHYDIGN
ncbi:hypothetical protein AL532_23630 [Pseudomonas monteilii]|uniref:Alanyl-tRNA editing protein n=1 Tax=Pseudomonas kurunegalensis TaxID=485880 RepID=A0ACC5UK24_9PSED|nr:MULTISPECIES: hypothetical protein [Pseudomonas]AVH39092.1 hypothetical protein AL532_23630 [Pseudomonas monteilii]MBV4514736.1 alanyl-tRNA editing protein [Pseudomonas kurunegalensis]MBZ3665234.1 alanyl-tRNA editing protein [Pseudomonas monteilii]MBZ3670579.1 alanyl-tRNA editing protein [Pseudomonas monteilii]MCE0908960.1 alanyl-tRNA editing protein [Pseudomonas kurunegalensis]